jgi:uncharacterized membrane protein YbhN (UPF0104 family)
MKRKWRILLTLLVVVSIAGIGIFLHRLRGTGFRWDVFLATFRQLNPGWLSASIALILLTYFGRALRWQVLMRPVCPNPNLWNLTVATIIGFTAIVLFGRPGELVRPYLIAAKERVSFSSQVAAWLLERIYDLLVVLLIFGFALTRIREDIASFGPGLQWVFRVGGYVVAGITGVCLAFLILVRNFSETMHRRLMRGLGFLPAHYLEKVEKVIRAFASGMESTRSHGFVLKLVGYTIAEWLVIIASNVCMFRAFPVTAQLVPMDSLIFVSFVAFGSIVQIPGVGGGMQVASVLILTQFFGLSLEEATGMAIIIWLTTYVIILPVGFYLAFREGINWRKLKEIESKAQQ